jgi:hypothetical protein
MLTLALASAVAYRLAGEAARRHERSTAQAPATSAIQLLVDRCAEDMVRQTCRVMGSGSDARVAEGTLVFVAGIGAIEASVYNELRASGDAMCQTVRRACISDWNGAPCQTARALYNSS